MHTRRARVFTSGRPPKPDPEGANADEVDPASHLNVGSLGYGVRPFSGFLLICPPRCPAHSSPAPRSNACLLRVTGTRDAALQAHSQEGVVYEMWLANHAKNEITDEVPRHPSLN